MGRGQGKGTDLGNNRPAWAPWTWEATDWHGQPGSMSAFEWSSKRHKLRVSRVFIDRFVISNERGQTIVGRGGRERRFQSLSMAQLAADIEAGVA